MFLASVAHETKNIVLGSGTINMPNTHPATVAAQVAMLDHILKGRFIMGISPGGLMSDAEVFGNYQKDRNAIFLESINMVLDIWRGEAPYNLSGQYFNVTTEKTKILEIGQGAILKPYQKPHPPIVVTAVAPHSKGVTEAAKRGWQPISANFLLPEWVASHWPRYVEGRQAVGASAEPGGVAGGEVDLRRRRRGDGEALRHSGRRAVPVLLHAARAEAGHVRPLEPLQARPERARRRRSRRSTSPTSW